MKTLPVEKQRVLQQDLQTLESLQIRYKERPDNAGIFTQLIGQQILLGDHLRDAIESVKVKVRAQYRITDLCMISILLYEMQGLALSPSSGNLHFHLLHQQQQQQALAQQQQQQQRLLEAEQQVRYHIIIIQEWLSGLVFRLSLFQPNNSAYDLWCVRSYTELMCSLHGDKATLIHKKCGH